MFSSLRSRLGSFINVKYCCTVLQQMIEQILFLMMKSVQFDRI